jgi:dynein heavy chain
MTNDKSGDMRKKFSEDFASLFGQKYPKEGLCFDYFYDPATDAHVHWQEKVCSYTPLLIGSKADATPFSQLNVETVESCRTRQLMKLLVQRGRYVMLVGTAGTGKTAQISEYLKTLDKDADGLLSTNITMSYFTDSAQLQAEMELAIDKRAGRMFGPPATKRLIYFIDDLNLPYIETYGTQNAIALITQLMQHGSIFDRADLGFRKEIVDTQYMAGMNPTAGSFEVCERAQRHFCTFACAMPGTTDLKLIYNQIFQGHLLGWPAAICELGEKIVETAIMLYQAVAARFLPSAVKFTYNWNMRELTNVFQGMTLAAQGDFSQPLALLRLFVHESCRVFQDRMISEQEMAEFETILRSTTAPRTSPSPTCPS